MPTLYEQLGVKGTASPGEIAVAYRKMAKKHHPDHSKEPDAKERFQLIHTAFEVLSDPARRKQYDEYGTYDKNEPDNKMAAVYSLLSAFLGQTIDGLLMSGREPLNVDLLGMVMQNIGNSIGQLKNQVKELTKKRDHYQKIADRFEVKKADKENLLHGLVIGPVKQINDMLAKQQQMLEDHQTALAICKWHKYTPVEKEKPQVVKEGDLRFIFGSFSGLG